MPPTKVAVFGAGGHGRVVADIALAMGLELSRFIDDAPNPPTVLFGRPVVSFDTFIRTVADECVALGIGDNRTREKVFERVRAAGTPVITLVHPRAWVSPSARVGEGVVVMAGAVMNTNASCGRGAIINTGAIVEHDCVVGDFAHVSSNAALAGGAIVGRRTHMGVGSNVLPLIRIGSDVRVGGGACIIRDVPDEQTVVGVPARELKKEKS